MIGNGCFEEMKRQDKQRRLETGAPYMPMMINKPCNSDFAMLVCKIDPEMLDKDAGRQTLHKMLDEAIEKYHSQTTPHDGMKDGIIELR